MMTASQSAEARARRAFLKYSAVAPVAIAYPAINFAATDSKSTTGTDRVFSPAPGNWRTFDVTTRVDIQNAQGATRLWLPLPSVESEWQRSMHHGLATNGKARLVSDSHYGARILAVEFADNDAQPFVELTCRVQTQSRAIDWRATTKTEDDVALRRYWTRATDLLPTGGLVRHTALDATRGARSDVDKARMLYDWVVSNTFREPKVRGCGQGDIETMLETGNLGGKCADINALFVGLCRAVGVPARDVYGLRLAPSAFGYRELGGNSASLKGAQHCRAEVYLRGYGWVAMDPADVTKVMRQESPQWIKSPADPLVAPVNRHLFGGWEGNWMAYNTAHDLTLPGSKGPKLGFLMYPVAETTAGRLDSYDPDAFKYQISSREI